MLKATKDLGTSSGLHHIFNLTSRCDRDQLKRCFHFTPYRTLIHHGQIFSYWCFTIDQRHEVYSHQIRKTSERHQETSKTIQVDFFHSQQKCYECSANSRRIFDPTIRKIEQNGTQTFKYFKFLSLRCRITDFKFYS